LSTQAQPELDRTSAKSQVCRVAVLGFGTVGRAVVEILSYRNPSSVKLTHIFNRNVASKHVSWVPKDVRWTENIDDVLASDVDVVIELMGGIEPAKQWVRRALESGKSVVTANKQLIANAGSELLELAQRKGLQLEFGASVAGGIPVLLGLQKGLSGDQIFKVTGILNGTCNYILTRIESSGVTFESALAEAQQFGYAEADPTDDLEGFDARAKLAILARVALQTQVHPEEIAVNSITPIQPVDFHYSSLLGSTIRQVSSAAIEGQRVVAFVQPAVIPTTSPLARVRGSENVVISTGKYGGETAFSGHGAGGHPTAVAVVSDVLLIAQQRGAAQVLPVKKQEVTSEVTTPHYVRFVVRDRPGIIAHLAKVFSKYSINIDAVFQKPGFPKTSLPFVITLEACGRSVLSEALAEISEADFHVEPPLSLPILKETN
jgi:homoserine dehydrogenase